MRNETVSIKSQRRIAEETWEMILQLPGGGQEKAPETQQIRPGQFINIKLEGMYLRRPISICDWTEDTLTIIYKTVGRGTEQMSRMKAGETLDILYPLGNGYTLTHEDSEESSRQTCFSRPLLIGGGAGAPPMYGLCKGLIDKGARPTVILGFKNAGEVFGKSRFTELGARVIVTTEDGSEGVQGFVTDAMDLAADEPYDSLFACGPEAMLKAVDGKAPKDIPGQMSFERRMGCGFGACMGCSCKTRYGSKRICVEGPVLERSEIIW